MTLESLSNEVRQFVKSSAYQFGDRTGFAINLREGITLPGRCSPTGYLDKLGIKKMPEKVMVICPGNGGLAVECFARGAKQVVAVEPRARYNRGINGVKQLLDSLWRLEQQYDRTMLWYPHWLKVGKEQGFKDFELILWPEGVEEITSPKETFRAVADCLAPGGKLVVELTHGNHQWVEKINSWRPTGHAVNEMAEAVFGSKPVGVDGGRNATTRIYTLVLPGKSSKKRDEEKARAETARKSKAEAKMKAEAEAKKKAEAEARVKKEKEKEKVEEKPTAPPPPPSKKLNPEAPRHVHVDLAKKPKDAKTPKSEKPKLKPAGDESGD